MNAVMSSIDLRWSGPTVLTALVLAPLVLATLALTACANSPPLVDRLSDGRVQGDADRVSVIGGRLDSLPLAVAHCARFGRSAQFSRTDGGRSVFRCVAPPG